MRQCSTATVIDIIAIDSNIEGAGCTQMQELAHQVTVGVGYIDVGTGGRCLCNNVPRDKIGCIVITAERIERQRLPFKIGTADGSRNVEVVT